MIRSLIKSYNHWIFNAFAATTERLSIYRMLYAVIIIFIVGIPQYADRIERFPDGIFNPPPIFGSLFSQMPHLLYFQITDVIITVGFFAVLIGFFTRTAGWITALLIIVNNGFIFSSGKIDHSLMVWFTLLVLSFSGWGQHYSLDCKIFSQKKPKEQYWTLSLVSMALGFGFFTAGLIKLVSGWLSFSDSMLRAFYLRNFYVQQKQDYLAPIFEKFDFFAFWELGDWFTILFEIGFLPVIFYPILFRFFTGLAVFFHGLILLMMNIAFAHYLAIYLAFWIPLLSDNFVKKWSDVYSKWTDQRNHSIFFYAVLLILYLLVLQLPGSIRIFIRDGFLIIGLITVVYFFLFKSRALFASPGIAGHKDVIRFDGVCNLCNSFIQFVLKRDIDKVFLFGTLQNSNEHAPQLETVEVHTASEKLSHSSAFLSVVRRLKGFWPYLYLTILIPRPLRDLIYRWVARNRYKWFGKRETCMIPSPDIAKRFV